MSRRPTPIHEKEEHLQHLVLQHQEQLRKLAHERNQITQRQALWLGRVDPNQRAKNVEEQKAARAALIQQLAVEQPAAEAMLESLKMGNSLAASRQAGQRVFHELQDIREAPGELPELLAGGQQPTGPYSTARVTPPRSSATAAGFAGQGTMTPPGGKLRKPYSQVPPSAQTTARASSAFPRPASNYPNYPTSNAPSSPLDPSAARAPAEEPKPAYVAELKEQINALASMLNQQLQQPAPFPQQNPWAPQQMPQQPMPQAPAPFPAAAPPPPVPPEVAGDPALRAAHASHMRDMAILRMDLDRARMEVDTARTMAELEQIKAMVNQMRQQTGKDDVPPAPPARPPDTAPNDVLMMNVEPSHPPSTSYYTYGTGTHTEGETEEEEESDEATEDDDLDAEAASPVPHGVVKADVMQIHIQSAGPFHKRGSYRMRVILYESLQPVEAGPDLTVGASTTYCTLAQIDDVQMARFNETLTLRGLSISPTMMLVFELYVAKQAVAGMPSKEQLVAWAYSNVLVQGEIVKGSQSVPLYRLPIMLAAQRNFSYDSAMIDFSLTQQEGYPGDIQPAQQMAGNVSRRDEAAGGRHEDVPGVSTDAWVRVARGTPPLEPFTPGDGFVVLVDGARFLPANVTITKVVGCIWTSEKQRLTDDFEAVSAPDADAFNPRYALQTALGQGAKAFDNCTATLLLTVYTKDKWTRSLRVLGYATLNVFLDPKTQQQPVSKNVRDYVLNQGAFQVPLHVGPPPANLAFRVDALEQGGVSRLPCASLLVRLLPTEMAKQQRRKALPAYADRVYDSMRDMPTQVERKLYNKYQARSPMLVREAARLLVMPAAAQRRIPEPMVAAAPPQKEGVLGRLFNRKSAAESSPAPSQAVAPSAPINLPAYSQGALPNTDVELLDWMEAQLRSDGRPDQPLNFNFASQYYQDLGFFVAVDGAMRLPRNLPSAALVTFAPPGSFYQDNPVVDDMKATLEYDMASCLSEPRWGDGFQHFADVVYEPGLAVFVDVRLLVPSTGTSAPAGFAILPVFEKNGPYVASGTYHLPLFQGVPSRHIIQEMSNTGDVDAVVKQQVKLGRLKPHEDCCSVLVRLVDASRHGQLPQPATAVGPKALQLPAYIADLGPKLLATMRKEVRNKTYAQVKPKNLTDDAWIEMMNDCILKVAGLDLQGQDDDDDDNGADSKQQAKKQQAGRKHRAPSKPGSVGPAGAAPQAAGAGAAVMPYMQQQQPMGMMVPMQQPMYQPPMQQPMYQPPMMGYVPAAGGMMPMQGMPMQPMPMQGMPMGYQPQTGAMMPMRPM